MASVVFQSQSLKYAESIHVQELSQRMSFQTGIKYNSNQVRKDLCFLYFKKIRILPLVLYVISKLAGAQLKVSFILEPPLFISISATDQNQWRYM